MRTTGRNFGEDFASKRVARALAGREALLATSWHNDLLNLSESIIAQYAAELIARRRKLTITLDHGLDDSRWLQEVECFIDQVIDESGGLARSSPERLRAVRWMIAGATAQFAASRSHLSTGMESADVANVA